jgi:transposase
VCCRTARIRLRVTRRQADRCYRLLRSAGDLWAWLLDTNRQRFQHGSPPIVGYQALCRELTSLDGFGELSVTGARSVLRRYSDAWFQAAKRRRHGAPAGFPRRKRALVPIRFYNQTFQWEGRRVRLPVAKGHPALWIRLARPIPYPASQVRAVTLMADGGQLWLAVTAAVPVQHHDLDPIGWQGWILASSTPTRWSPPKRACCCRGGRSGPRASCTCMINKLDYGEGCLKGH